MAVRSMFVPVMVLAICCSLCHSQSTYKFTENSYDAYEDSEVVRVVVERSGDTAGSGSVRIATLAASASSGADYLSVNRVLDFAPGGTRATVDITILDDAITDAGETFTVRLSDPTGGTTGNPSEATVVIKDGAKPSEGLADEILIAIIIACIAAVLILVVCCALIYCLRFQRNVKEDVVYMRRPRPAAEPLPVHYTPELERRPITPPTFRPYTPPPEARPRTPPPAQPNANTQVMVINEPSEPIVEPPPRKPTQVIVIRPQTPEIIRSRPRHEGQTEVTIDRRRPRSASPILEPRRYHDDYDRGPIYIDDRPPSPITIHRRVIRKPVPRSSNGFPGEEFDAMSRGSRGHSGFNGGFGGRDGFNGGFGGNGFSGGFGGRDALLNLPPGHGLYGPSNLPQGRSPFGQGLGPFGAGLGPFGSGQGQFGPQLPPNFGLGSALPPAGAGGFGSGFGPFPPPGFKPPRSRPGFYGPAY